MSQPGRPDLGIKPQRAGLVTELKRPATIISLILAIVGVAGSVVIGLYFYRAGIKQGQLAFYPAQVQVFDVTVAPHSPSPPLTVLDRDHNPITDNVYAATVTVWNAGNAEIKTDDIRIPFRIVLDGDPKIIEWAPTFYTRDNMDKFDIRPDHTITWQHFDPGEGLKMRILYEAKHEEKINITGYAVNTAPIPNGVISGPSTVWTTAIFAVFVMLIIAAIVIIVSVYFVLFTHNPTIRDYANTFVRVLAGFVIGATLVFLAATHPVQPNLPF